MSMLRNPRHWLVAALPIAAVLVIACSPDVTVESGDSAPTLSVNGHGSVSAPADTAVLDIGVNVVRDTVAEARDDAATAMTRLRDSLAGNDIDDEDIATTQFNVFPEIDFRGETQEIRGFRVFNTVMVRIRDIDRSAEVIDEAIVAVGDEVTVNGIRFTIDETGPMLAQAREAAVADARAKAEELADLADVELGALTSISESGGGGDPFPFVLEEAQSLDIGGAPSRIDGGEVSVTVNVSVVFAID